MSRNLNKNNQLFLGLTPTICRAGGVLESQEPAGAEGSGSGREGTTKGLDIVPFKCVYVVIVQQLRQRDMSKSKMEVIVRKPIDREDSFQFAKPLRSLLPQLNILYEIGKGSFGRVFTGTIKQNCILNVFILNKQSLHNKTEEQFKAYKIMVDHFFRVAKILQKHPHPNLVNVIMTNKQIEPFTKVFIVTEKGGHTLKEYLKKLNSEGTPEIQFLIKVRLIQQLLRAVVHLHQLGISIGNFLLNQIYVEPEKKVLKLKVNREFKSNPMPLTLESKTLLSNDMSQLMKLLESVFLGHDSTLLVRPVSSEVIPRVSKGALSENNKSSPEYGKALSMSLPQSVYKETHQEMVKLVRRIEDQDMSSRDLYLKFRSTKKGCRDKTHKESIEKALLTSTSESIGLDDNAVQLNTLSSEFIRAKFKGEEISSKDLLNNHSVKPSEAKISYFQCLGEIIGTLKNRASSD